MGLRKGEGGREDDRYNNNLWRGFSVSGCLRQRPAWSHVTPSINVTLFILEAFVGGFLSMA
jgi:hypothetical protein